MWRRRYSALALLTRRLALLYVALGLCRGIFLLANHEAIGPLEGFWRLVQGALVFDTAGICYVMLPFIVASLLPFRFTERSGYRKGLRIYYMVMAAASVVLNLADAVYFHYAGKRFTAEEFHFASNDNSLQLFGKFAGENWFLFLVALLILGGVWAAYGGKKTGDRRQETGVLGYGVDTLILLAAIYLSFGAIRGGFTRTTRPITLSNAAAYAATPAQANLILSNPFCVIRTLGAAQVVVPDYFPSEETEAIFSPCHYSYDRTPVELPSLAGRNVIVVVLESFSAEHSALLNPDLYPDGQGFTPFLDSLMRAGYYFPDAHSNGRKSIEALPSILSSMPSLQTPFVLMPQSLGQSEALPRILARQGYRTAFFCGSERGSMGFGAYANSAGIERFYGREDYQKARGNDDHDGYWGIWDEPFIDFMGEELTTFEQPFMAALFTLSSHHPFVVPAQYEGLPAGRTKVHKGVQYTDLAIRRFFEKYSAEAWFRNAVFVFAADHVSSETFAPKSLTPTGNTHIISFIYTPDGALCGRHPGVSQQIDLMPTLLGLLGYDVPYFAFGRDLLGEPARPAVAVNYLGQQYQAIGDSTVIYFDGKQVTAAYARTDTLQQTNRVDSLDTAAQERYLKAFIQQYYRHVAAEDYLVP